MKVLVNSSDRELEELLIEERQAVKDNNGTKDSQEGMLAFLEKRKPLFNK
jgi:enoyl-CoA hydratase